MTTLAIANLWDVSVGPDIVAYLEKIDATLAPFQGCFLVHGNRPECLEGNFQGDLVIISFPNRQNAEAWYQSKAYQEILPLRLNNAQGNTILIDTVPGDHRATDILKTIMG
jgi:uncharacterized protein (DUF1330 family)